MDEINTEAWVKDEKNVWKAVKLEVNMENNINFQYKNPNSDDVDNITKLKYLNEPSILNAVSQRYKRDQIYTNSGKILIAVNPFKQLNIYQKDYFQKFYESNNDESPHIFKIAKNTILEDNELNLNESNVNHSVLISGESGAGKTQSAKYVMEYLSYVSNNFELEDEQHLDQSIEQIILSSNPVLEAFGNAKTRRNDNSSRFGKYIQINMKNKKIKGGKIKTYLLEKVRLVNVPQDERNFHIFYQILKGADKKLLNNLYINESDLNIFNSLNIDDLKSNKNNHLDQKKINFLQEDEHNYLETIKSLKSFNITDTYLNDFY